MPKIDVSHKDLCNLIGRKLSAEQLGDEVLFAKAELDEVNGDAFKIDIKDTNRPDLWSAEGVAREIRAKYKPGIPKYDVRKSPFVVNVEKSVETVRPYTACAVVKGLKINDTTMSQLLQLQEKGAGTFGRNRKEVAIGVYGLGRIKFPITYKAISPDGIRFVPLDFKEKMTPKEILEKHPKGKEFGHLLAGKSMYPLFIDAEGEVLSIPPIINSDHSGKVTEKTTDIFIECSGFDKKFLYTALNVLVSALHERGGIIYGVKVVYGKQSSVTPDLTPKKFRVSVDYINKISGLQLPVKDVVKLLEKSLYVATAKGKNIELLYPAYRQDLMHERDVVEDVLIAYGFNKIEPVIPKLITKGGIFKEQSYIENISEIMTGAGFQEILSYTLTNVENVFQRMETKGEAVELENPMSANWSVFRTWLLPGILEFLSKNKHVEYPHSVFETGNVVLRDNSSTRAKDVTKLAAAVSATIVNYETISSYLDALLKNLGIEYTLRKNTHPSFAEGRSAEIVSCGKHLGLIGEIHPAVLNNWTLEKPVVAFEIDLEEVFELLRKK